MTSQFNRAILHYARIICQCPALWRVNSTDQLKKGQLHNTLYYSNLPMSRSVTSKWNRPTLKKGNYTTHYTRVICQCPALWRVNCNLKKGNYITHYARVICQCPALWRINGTDQLKKGQLHNTLCPESFEYTILNRTLDYSNLHTE